MPDRSFEARFLRETGPVERHVNNSSMSVANVDLLITARGKENQDQ